MLWKRLTSKKLSGIRIRIHPNSDPDVCRIAPKVLWIHYVVGVVIIIITALHWDGNEPIRFCSNNGSISRKFRFVRCVVVWTVRTVRLRWSNGVLRRRGPQVVAGGSRVDRVRLRSAWLPGHLHARIGVRAVDRGHYRCQHVATTHVDRLSITDRSFVSRCCVLY